MPQKFLSIKNFDKYQTSTTKESRPWIKLYKSILGDPEFIKLSTHHRFLYMGLLLLADECGNKIYNDHTYLRQRLYILDTDPIQTPYKTNTDGIQKADKAHTKLDLKPLYRAGFLETSNLPRTLSDLRIREDLRLKTKIEDSAVSPTPTKPQLSRLQKLESFELKSSDRIWAATTLSVQNADEYVEEFKDYWRGVDEKKLKADWHATFRNRLRYLKEHNQLKKESVW